MVEDFIHVLKLMRRTSPESKIFTLGIHSNDIDFSGVPKVYFLVAYFFIICR